MSGNKRYFIGIFILAVMLIAELLVFFLLSRQKDIAKQKEIEFALAQLSKSPELVTVKYRVDSLYCIDGRRNRINLFGISLWQIERYACWKIKSEVIAGYDWDKINWQMSKDKVILQVPSPELLGVNHKKGKLVYVKNWGEFSLREKDFMPEIRTRAIKIAQELGILENAERNLKILSGLLEEKINLPVKIEPSAEINKK